MRKTELNMPWTAKEMYTGWQVVDCKGNIVACGIECGDDMGQWLANLIAKAPEMLMALKGMCAYVELKTESPERHVVYKDAKEVLDSIR